MPSHVNISTGEIETLNTEPIVDRYTGDFLTGLTNVKAKIRRISDDLMLDWSDYTFKAAGSVTQKLLTFTEVDATNFPGEYMVDFNTASITNPNSDDIYQVTVIEDGTEDAANLPQTGEIRVGDWVDSIQNILTNVLSVNSRLPLTPANEATAALILKILKNKLVLQDGTTSNWILYDDDDTTPLITWSVQDVSDSNVVQPPGAPSRRSRGV